MFTLLRRLRARLKYRHHERDLKRELEIHRAMAQWDIEAGGLSAAEARSAATRALGNTTYMREEARSVWIARWLEHTWQDVRYAITSFRRQPVFALGAVTMLGVGLGLVITVFTYADARYLRPWRVPNSEALRLVRSTGAPGSDYRSVSMPEYRYLREHSKTMRSLVVTVRGGGADLRYGSVVEPVRGMTISADYFEALGVRLVAGRPFFRSDDSTATSVVVISERLWTELFNRDPSALGRSVHLGRTALTVVGVAPSSFIDPHGPGIDIWRVMNLSEYADPRHRAFPFAMFGRLADDVSEAQAAAELEHLSRQFRSSVQLHPVAFVLRDTRPWSSGIGEGAQVVGLVFLALIIVQLVACANVGNLMLARALVRQREIAVRLSLGASRSRVVRQLVTEALVLAVAAGGLGLTITTLVPFVMAALEPGVDPAFYAPTSTTLAVTGVMSLLTALACGLAPAIRATGVSFAAVTSEHHGPTLRLARFSRFLLASQIALATVLLMSAGLLTRAVSHASAMDPGFDADAIQEISFTLPSGVPLQGRGTLPLELAQAAATAGLPPLALSFPAPVEDVPYIDEFRTTQSSQVVSVAAKNVSENYFEVLGVQLLAGRGPSARNGVREVVVSQTLAESLWPNQHALGQVVIVGRGSDTSQTKVVVGIAPDLFVRSLSRTQPIAYSGTENGVSNIFVRGPDNALLDRLQGLVNSLEPGAVLSTSPLRERLVDSLETARVGGLVAWSIGALGLLLATVGAFGVFAHAVEEKRREIGIRMALGAQASQVVRMVLHSTQRPVLFGLATGAALAVVATPLFRSHLYGLSPMDPIAFLQVASLLTMAALIATVVPARRATRVNPVEALRRD